MHLISSILTLIFRNKAVLRCKNVILGRIGVLKPPNKDFIEKLDASDPSFWESAIDNESELWFRRFRAWLIHPKRSIKAVYRDELKQTKRKLTDDAIPPSIWSTAQKYYLWALRAEAYDRYTLKEDHIDYQKRRSELKDEQWRDAKMLREKARQMLDFPLTRQTVKQGEDGRTTIVIEPMRWGMSDVSKMLQLASELQGRSLETYSDMDEMKALEVLVQTGWLPPTVLAIAGEKIDQMKLAMQQVFQTVNVPAVAIAELVTEAPRLIEAEVEEVS